MNARVIEVYIGRRMYSDHAPTVMTWGCKGRNESKYIFWRLNNWLLEQRIKGRICGENKNHFDINRPSRGYNNVGDILFFIYILYKRGINIT